MGSSSRLLIYTLWMLIFPELFTVFQEGEAAHAVKRFTGLYTGPYFDPTTTTNITTQLGTHAYIPCKIKQLGNKSVSWIRRRDAHILTVDRYTFIADDRFQAFFVEATDTWTLQVKYVQARDAGQYECQVSTEPKMSHFITLNVVVPKIEIEGESDIYVKRGSTVQLKCVITQSLEEPAYIFWYHDGERVLKYDQSQIDIRMVRKGTDTTISTITIFRTRPDDSGNYTCSPSNLDSASVYLHVLNVAVVEILLILKAYLKITTGRCKSNDSLIGKTVLITGANSGLGFETSLDMARRGARVILACRNEEKAREACNKIKKETSNGDVIYKIVDFASLTSVRKLAEDINATERCLDVLINNAGAGGLGNKYTEDGLQLTMQVNYFAPFLLTNLLLGLLTKSPSSRIINISSIAAKFGTMDIKNINEYKGDTAQYCISKLCNIIFTIELASRLKDTNITTFSLHPGVTNTELFQTMPYIMRKITYFILTVFGKSAKEGAQTSIYLAVERDIESFSGQHFHDCRPVKRYGNVDVTLAKQLWEKTEEIVKLNAS